MIEWLLVAIIVTSTTVGDVLKSIGMRHHGEIHDFRPGALGRVLASIAQNRYIIGSVTAMTVSFFAFMALLSIANLSFAVPATAATYAFETLLAKFLLKEQVGWRRWAGAFLVLCGVVLLSV